jgi:hypothetical protein
MPSPIITSLSPQSVSTVNVIFCGLLLKWLLCCLHSLFKQQQYLDGLYLIGRMLAYCVWGPEFYPQHHKNQTKKKMMTLFVPVEVFLVNFGVSEKTMIFFSLSSLLFFKWLNWFCAHEEEKWLYLHTEVLISLVNNKSTLFLLSLQWGPTIIYSTFWAYSFRQHDYNPLARTVQNYTYLYFTLLNFLSPDIPLTQQEYLSFNLQMRKSYLVFGHWMHMEIRNVSTFI